jgi:tetratricopeptide (TPR) repeat protein
MEEPFMIGIRGLLTTLFLLGFVVAARTSALCQELPDTEANRAHGVVGCTSTSTGIYCPGRSSSSSYRAPTGPTPEELKRAREEKDIKEAASDAVDKGNAFYKKGDWANALKFYKEALEYDPDDQDALSNIEQVRKKMAGERQIGRDLKTADYESRNADGLSNKDAIKNAAGRGFDTSGASAGAIGAPAVYAGSAQYKDPVIPPSKRTPAVTRMERDRQAARKELQFLQEQLKAVDPKTDPVQISKIKQQESTLKNKIRTLNFSITEQLKEPSTAGAQK